MGGFLRKGLAVRVLLAQLCHHSHSLDIGRHGIIILIPLNTRSKQFGPLELELIGRFRQGRVDGQFGFIMGVASGTDGK